MLRTTLSTEFVARFEPSLMLTNAERSALENVAVKRVELGPDQDIVREGDRPSRSVLVIDGLVCTSKVTGSGKRQMTAFHVPGDMPDLLSLHLQLMDSDVRTVIPTTVGFIEHRDLRRLCEHNPRIAASLWRTTLIDASIFREWVVNVGQRRGLSRLAHLFCEMMMRMGAVGRSKEGRCAFDVTQTDLSEAVGLTAVHVNRSLQDLRKRGLISFAKGVLTIHDWDGLADLGDFHSDYLHLDEVTLGRVGNARRRGRQAEPMGLRHPATSSA